MESKNRFLNQVIERARGFHFLIFVLFHFGLIQLAGLVPVFSSLAHAKDLYQETQSMSEVRVGGMAHAVGPRAGGKESGFDGNLEFLFRTPENNLFKVIFKPRPVLGMTPNINGDTSQLYVGLSWRFHFNKPYFFGFTLGGAVHDGKLRSSSSSKRELGSRFLFRDSFEIGHQISKKLSIAIVIDHISSLYLASRNEGLDTLGIRMGFKF